MSPERSSEREPVVLDDFEAIAREAMAPRDFAEVVQLAPGNVTHRRARAAFDAITLQPSVLPGVAAPDTSLTVLGRPIAWPVMLAPAGKQTRAHPDGEVAIARAAAGAGTAFVLSANPGCEPRDVAAAATGPRWLQLYLFRDPAETVRRVRLAEELEFDGLCLTLDAHWPAKRPWRADGHVAAPSPAAGTTRARHHVVAPAERSHADPAATWADVERLRASTRLPIVAKGIMNASDAVRAVDAGLDAVLVSNHGGRLGQTQATIEVLPEIAAAVGGRAEVYLDGGIRSGSDVVKALALGARAVLIGRPVFWGLAAGGETGLLRLLDILREEVEVTLMLLGRPSLDRVDRTAVRVGAPWSTIEPGS